MSFRSCWGNKLPKKFCGFGYRSVVILTFRNILMSTRTITFALTRSLTMISARPCLGERLTVLSIISICFIAFATSSAHCEDYSTSSTYPNALVQQIDSFLDDSQSEDYSVSTDVRDSLTNVKSLLGSIDSKLHENPSELLPLLKQLDEMNTELSAKNEFPSRAALEEIRLHMDRFAMLTVAACEAIGNDPASSTEIRPRTISDLERLLAETQKLETFFSGFRAKAADHWISFFDLQTLEQTIAEVLASVDTEDASLIMELSTEQIHKISEIVNQIQRKLEKPFDREQAQFLARSPLGNWKNELNNWNENTAEPIELLTVVANYESSRSFSDSAALSDVAFRLSVSPSKEYRVLGSVAQEIYGGPNIKIFVSEVLINHFLPVRAAEFERFHDVVVGRPVVGSRQTDTWIKLALEPSPDKLSMSLQVNGTVSATGNTKAAGTKLVSDTYANYKAVKRLEWTERGITVFPTAVGVSNKTYLRSVKTGLDGLPILSGIAQNIARGQFDNNEGQANAETKAKITNQVANRVNSEANGHFAKFNANYQKSVLEPMERSSLVLEKKGASTTKDWLLSSWRLVSASSLGSHTLEPETIHGSFADLKIHESAIKTAIQILDLEGRTISVAELKKLIAEKSGRTEFDLPGDDDDVLITFAAKDPVLVRFFDGRMEISLSIAAMKVNKSVWRNFRFIVNYQPGLDENGNLCLIRDANMNMIGKLNMGTQLALRTVLTKLFPANKVIPLVPPIMHNDERFVDLTTGHCRMENGWFAVAVVGKPQSNSFVDENAKTVPSQKQYANEAVK